MFRYTAAEEAAIAREEANMDWFDQNMPEWETAEQADRFLSERDFPVSEDTEGVSDEDWSAFLEMTWCDPAERMLG